MGCANRDLSTTSVVASRSANMGSGRLGPHLGWPRTGEGTRYQRIRTRQSGLGTRARRQEQVTGSLVGCQPWTTSQGPGDVWTTRPPIGSPPVMVVWGAGGVLATRLGDLSLCGTKRGPPSQLLCVEQSSWCLTWLSAGQARSPRLVSSNTPCLQARPNGNFSSPMRASSWHQRLRHSI